MQAAERTLHNDEGPVRQLCGPENDRPRRSPSEKAPPTEDPAAHRHPAPVRLREAHPRQAGKVLHEEQRRARADRRGPREHDAMIAVVSLLVCSFFLSSRMHAARLVNQM